MGCGTVYQILLPTVVGREGSGFTEAVVKFCWVQSPVCISVVLDLEDGVLVELVWVGLDFQIKYERDVVRANVEAWVDVDESVGNVWGHEKFV